MIFMRKPKVKEEEKKGRKRKHKKTRSRKSVCSCKTRWPKTCYAGKITIILMWTMMKQWQYNRLSIIAKRISIKFLFMRQIRKI